MTTKHEGKCQNCGCDRQNHTRKGCHSTWKQGTEFCDCTKFIPLAAVDGAGMRERFSQTKFAKGGGSSFECSDYEGMYADLLEFIQAELSRLRFQILEEREKLAELEHDQWIAWSKDIAETEPSLNVARLARWRKLWRPYAELTEAEKDQDREWADKTLSIINHAFKDL